MGEKKIRDGLPRGRRVMSVCGRGSRRRLSAKRGGKQLARPRRPEVAGKKFLSAESVAAALGQGSFGEKTRCYPLKMEGDGRGMVPESKPDHGGNMEKSCIGAERAGMLLAGQPAYRQKRAMSIEEEGTSVHRVTRPNACSNRQWARFHGRNNLAVPLKKRKQRRIRDLGRGAMTTSAIEPLKGTIPSYSRGRGHGVKPRGRKKKADDFKRSRATVFRTAAMGRNTVDDCRAEGFTGRPGRNAHQKNRTKK